MLCLESCCLGIYHTFGVCVHFSGCFSDVIPHGFEILIFARYTIRLRSTTSGAASNQYALYVQSTQLALSRDHNKSIFERKARHTNLR